MINILVVDDNPEKLQNINRVLRQIENDDVCIIRKNDIASAKKELREKNIDIMILDIYLPLNFGDADVMQDGGMKLLNQIKKSRHYAYPKYVISLSKYEDGTDVFSKSEGNIHTSIVYNENSNEWEVKLQSCVEAAIAVVSNGIVHRRYDYDIGVICALKEEVDYIAEILEGVETKKVEYDDDIYNVGFFQKEDRKIRVVFTSANQMGMVAATSLTTKLINNFSPRYLVMTGIAGGTKEDKMNIGDVIVATKAWDYRAGKDIRKDDGAQHINTIDQQSINTTLISYCRQLENDVEKLREIKDSFKNGDKPDTELKLLLGPVVSGASVVTDPEIVQDVLLEQDRNVLGIEMEIYGMYYAANWAINPKPQFIAMKAISDFANSSKGDRYHKYASYTSAKVFEVLAKEYFEYPVC